MGVKNAKLSIIIVYLELINSKSLPNVQKQEGPALASK